YYDDLIDAGKSNQRVAGNCNRRAGLIRDDLSADEGAGTEAAVVRDVGFDDQHAILLADGRAEAFDVTEIGIRIALDRNADALAVANVVRFALRHFGAQSQRINSHHIHNRRARGEVFTDARFLFLPDA